MNLTDAVEHYQENVEQADAELAQSIKLSECVHGDSTVAGDDSVADGVYCNDCGKGFSVDDWITYLESRPKQ